MHWVWDCVTCTVNSKTWTKFVGSSLKPNLVITCNELTIVVYSVLCLGSYECSMFLVNASIRSISNIRSPLVGLQTGFSFDSCGGALPNGLVVVFVWSHFSVEKGGAAAVLEEPQIVAPSKRLQLLRRSH